MDSAYAYIDVQLKKRYDLIPNILIISKRYMEHEKTVLLEITEIRTKLEENLSSQNTNENLSERFKLEDSLEDYPDLYSHKRMIQAQSSYNEV